MIKFTLPFLLSLLLCTLLTDHVTFVQCQNETTTDNLWEAYEKCKNKLGKPNWLCDPNNRVDAQTAAKLNDLLWRFQTEVPCYCKLTKDCFRYDSVKTVSGGVVASMIIVDSFPQTYEKTIKKIYDDAGLDAKGSCSNGLLVILGYKTYEMFTFRGILTGMTLSAQQAKDAMNRTALELQATGGESRFALPLLLTEYLDRLKSANYGRSRTWESMVGMVCAAVICAIAAAFALAIFFAGCCMKKRKKPWRLDQEPKLALSEKAHQAKLAKAAIKRHHQKALTFPKPPPGGTTRGAPAEEPYYFVSEPASTMYSTLPRTHYPGSPIHGYGPPEAQSSPRQPGGTYQSPEKRGQNGRSRRHSLPLELRTPASSANPYPYPNVDVGEASPRSTATSQAYLVPPYHVPLHLERETQSKNYFVDDDVEGTPRSTATPAVSTPKNR